MDELIHNANEALGFETESLTIEDVKLLESLQNQSGDDWANVRLLLGARPYLKNIRSCSFNPGEGHIIIGAMIGIVSLGDGVSACSGLKNSHFFGDCFLSSGCLVQDTSMLCNAFIGTESVIMKCGQIIGGQQFGRSFPSNLGNFIEINVGPETGGRGVIAHVNMTFEQLCGQIFKIRDTTQSQIVPEVATSRTCSSSMSIIGPQASIINCALIRRSLLGPCAQVHSSTVDSCTVWSSSSRSVRVLAGSSLERCLLQPGCVVDKASRAVAVFMCEASSISEGARVCDSILGPDASVAGGECHHSLLGPFVGFHHHSLLIASIWPSGRGNIGYGAMIGANHTGRVNDQECWPGEGCFFGLGCAIKFPVNLVDAPYSIIAPRTTLSPQALRFPFSLICEYNAPVSGGSSVRTVPVDACALKPGWVLYGNPYMLDRAALKFSSRRKAQSSSTDYAPLRPTLIRRVISARSRLRRALAAHSLLRQARREPPPPPPLPQLDRSDTGDSSESSPSAASETIIGSDLTVEGDVKGKGEGEGEEVWTERELPGAGRCVVTLKDATRAVAAYTALIRRYALHGLLALLLIDPTPQSMAPIVDELRTTMKVDGGSGEEGEGEGGRGWERAMMESVAEDLRSLSQPAPSSHPLAIAAAREGVFVVDWHIRHVLRHQVQTLCAEFREVIGDAPLSSQPSSSSSISSQSSSSSPSPPSSSPSSPPPPSSLFDLVCASQQVYATLLVQHAWLRPLLEALVQLERQYADSMAVCRLRDGERGRRIIPDYDDVNVAGVRAERDGVVTKAKSRTEAIERVVGIVLGGGKAS